MLWCLRLIGVGVGRFDGIPGSIDSVSSSRARAMLSARLPATPVAFPARATTVLRQSILHLTGEVVRQQVVCIEAHAGDVHLRAQREVQYGCLGALAAVEEAPGCFSTLC